MNALACDYLAMEVGFREAGRSRFMAKYSISGPDNNFCVYVFDAPNDGASAGHMFAR
jgi:hypothetical protein